MLNSSVCKKKALFKNTTLFNCFLFCFVFSAEATGELSQAVFPLAHITAAIIKILQLLLTHSFECGCLRQLNSVSCVCSAVLCLEARRRVLVGNPDHREVTSVEPRFHVLGFFHQKNQQLTFQPQSSHYRTFLQRELASLWL